MTPALTWSSRSYYFQQTVCLKISCNTKSMYVGAIRLLKKQANYKYSMIEDIFL